GQLGEYVGGYTDWLRQRPSPGVAAVAKPAPAPAPSAAATPPRRKLSYKETRELEQLPAVIERLEAELAARGEAMNDPAYFQQGAAAITAANAAVSTLQAELDAAYAR